MEKIRASKSYVLTVAVVVLLALLIGKTWTVEGQENKLMPVPFTDVTVADEFWKPRLETNRKVTIPYAFKKCEETGRIDNFGKAAARLSSPKSGMMKGKFEGIRFNDSDVFKVIEGAAYSLSLYPEPNLDKYLDELIAKIAAAQEEDGYLYTCRTIDPNNLPQGAGGTRWSFLAQSHELYNVGHMYEAAVAHYQATGKRTFLDIAVKNAELIDRVFGPNKKRDVPGHQEIEIGLVKLYRVTGNEKYLKLAKFFLDERGHAHDRKLYGPYCQDHQPVTEQTDAVGHAVRAGYMYTGMADVAALIRQRRNAKYLEALQRIWQNVVSKKLYITGGVGARAGGESFGNDYELPNKTAYCETCAAIANALWNHRMFLLEGSAKYIDVLERIIYNGFLSGISLGGDTFFYPNPLESPGNYERSPWFGCACCPTNIVRFLPSIPGYAYAYKDDSLYVNLFIGGNATIKMDRTVHIRQETRYPWDGDVKITVEPERSAEFAIYIRIPGWAQNSPMPSDLYHYADNSQDKVMLKVNNKPLTLNMDKGFACIRRQWEKGDEIKIHLPMPVRRVLCHDKVQDNSGKTALERGPVVYCFEAVDNPQGVANLMLPPNAKLHAEYRRELLGGIVTIKGLGKIRQQAEEQASLNPERDPLRENIEITAIPYYAWAHRGKSEMSVWLPQSVEKRAD